MTDSREDEDDREDPARPGIDMVMIVTYAGREERGSKFLCGIAGDVVPMARQGSTEDATRSGESIPAASPIDVN